MDASLQRSMNIRHCLGQWCASSIDKKQVFRRPLSNVAEPVIEATLRFAPHCLIIFVSPLSNRFIQPMLFHQHSPSQAVICWVFCCVPGFALGHCASFKPFWPLALAQLALAAIILQALRRFRGAVLFRGLRSSSSWGFPFWLLGLTLRSSGPAFCGPLTLAVSAL